MDFPVELRPSARTQRIGYIKSRLKSYLPQFFRRLFMSKEDDIFYYEITRGLQHDLAKRGTRIDTYNSTYNTLIVQWYLEKMKDELG